MSPEPNPTGQHPTGPNPVAPAGRDAARNPAAALARRGRGRVARLFAAALEGDADADEELRCLAPWDPSAACAFEALVVAEIELQARHHHPPPAPTHQVDQVLAALREAGAWR